MAEGLHCVTLVSLGCWLVTVLLKITRLAFPGSAQPAAKLCQPSHASQEEHRCVL